MTLRGETDQPISVQGDFYNLVAPALFLEAHRAFASADNFFRAAGLICLRAGAFFAGAEAFFGADLPFCFAHRNFIAAEIRLRAAGLIVRARGTAFEDCAWGGRPRRGRDDASDPSRAVIAPSSRLNTALRSSSIWWMFILKPPIWGQCSRVTKLIILWSSVLRR